MADGVSFRPCKQWILCETETVTSFTNWQLNMEYHLSLNKEFAPFLAMEWSKKSTRNRGLTDDSTQIEESNRKTAVQKNVILERMLEMVSQFSPPALRNHIVIKSTSLAWIWDVIHKHYSFSQSEVNFLKLYSVQQNEDENYQTFFQKILSHLEDNLLTATSDILHNGGRRTIDEEMSPTAERLAVYLWLILIDPRLPAYISKIYVHELQSKSLKDIQPQLADSMDSLLQNMNAHERAQMHLSRSTDHNERSNETYKKEDNILFSQTGSRKFCAVCKLAGRRYTEHDIQSCCYLSKQERFSIANASRENLSDSTEFLDNDIEHEINVAPVIPSCEVTPYFYAFYKHIPCLIMVDTDATSSFVSNNFLKFAGVDIHLVQQSVDGIDKTLQGDVQFMLNNGGFDFHVTAVVKETLGCDILVNNSFCKQNDIEIDLETEEIYFRSQRIPYGNKSKKSHNDTSRVESFVLRNDVTRVILPGEFVEIRSDAFSEYEGEISIEPRIDSPMDGEWPKPRISRVIQGTIRIPNLGQYPIQLNKAQHFAQIRRVIIPEVSHMRTNSEESLYGTYTNDAKVSVDCLDNDKHISSHSVTVDPDNLLTDTEKLQFLNINKLFDVVFDNNFCTYKNNSRTIQVDINLGDVVPLPEKGKLPYYSPSDMHLLQEEVDNLERLGVLGKPEEIGVPVQYISPSFLVTKSTGGHGLFTAFNQLYQYTQNIPSDVSSCGDALRKLSSWEYIIKTDLTILFYQIPVAKSSIPYLGIVTPFKGLRVYLRTAIGMPGSTEALQELTLKVFGDMIHEGFVMITANDLYVCGNNIIELSQNWRKVLQCMQDHKLHLSPSETIICPKQTSVLGWVWNTGTLTLNPHNIAPLASVDPPKTYPSMRSFIGTFKSISRCIPRCASLISPLEDAIKELQGSHYIEWSAELTTYFKQTQEALKYPLTLTIPRPSDKLLITGDASPQNKGLGVTLSIIRDAQQLTAEYFSFKLKSYQLTWMPCEYEALTIAMGIEHFSPYIKVSKHPLLVKTDNISCIQAYHNLCKGMFSVSPRISTFLSTICSYRVTVIPLKEESNQTSYSSWQQPPECIGKSCQICKFVGECTSSVVHNLTVTAILSGSVDMPYLNSSAWRSAQHECSQLRRTYVHLIQGTRPSKHARNLRDLRRYIQVASVNDHGLLVVRNTDLSGHENMLIIVPTHILIGLLTALHLRLNHPTKHELYKLFCRYFYALNCTVVINQVLERCNQCNPTIKLPNETFPRTSTHLADKTGYQVSVDTEELLPAISTLTQEEVFKSHNDQNSCISKPPDGRLDEHAIDCDSIHIKHEGDIFLDRYLVPPTPGTQKVRNDISTDLSNKILNQNSESGTSSEQICDIKQILNSNKQIINTDNPPPREINPSQNLPATNNFESSLKQPSYTLKHRSASWIRI